MPLEYSHIAVAGLLVSLEEAKAHLNITDTDHDAYASMILEAAQDRILAKLGLAVDPTWTDTTAPPTVRHAILLLIDAFNERRGGAESQEELQKALKSISELLAFHCDPTIA